MVVYAIVKTDLPYESSAAEQNITNAKAMDVIQRPAAGAACGAAAASAANATATDNEREEGEIIDDQEFELILSSEEEEYSVRERIKQLEAKNNELEQIAKISGSYTTEYTYLSPSLSIRYTPHPAPYYPHDRDVQIVSDASYISAEEIDSTKRKKRHKAKRSRREHNAKHHSRSTRDHYYRSVSKRRREEHAERRYNPHLETILIDSYDSLSNDDARYSSDDEHAGDMNALKLNRDKLRFALARDNGKHAPRGSLKARLKIKKDAWSVNEQQQHNDCELTHKETPELSIVAQQTKNAEVVEQSDDSDSLEEQELRLIALKSAVLKKHMARKKRDAESAYSPTDFIANDTFDGPGSSDIDVIMDISPAQSPDRVISPIAESFVDTKPVDMELATSESENEHHNNSELPSMSWLPTPIDNFNSIMTNAVCDPTVPYGLYMHDNLPTIVPAPIVIDDDDDVPPPPPPFYLGTDQMDECTMSNNSYSLPDANCSEREFINDIQQSSIENSCSSQVLASDKPDVVSSDEEELRAFLLSKFQKSVKASTKRTYNDIPKQDTAVAAAKNQTAKKVKNDDNSDSNENDDPETLRKLLLSSLTKKKLKDSNADCAPFVLKEAVRRFQANNAIGNALNDVKEQSNGCEILQSNFASADKLSNATIAPATVPVAEPVPESEPVPECISESTNKTDVINHKSAFAAFATTESQVVPPVNGLLLTDTSASVTEKNMLERTENHSKNIETKEFSKQIDNTKQNDQKVNELVGVNKTVKVTNSLDSSKTIINNLAIANVQPLKIIKPNKIINKSPQVQRKVIDPPTLQQLAKESKEVSVKPAAAAAKTVNGVSTSRLITTADRASIKVNKLIINLEDSENDCDEYCDMANIGDAENSQMSYASVNLYCDNFSPISLPMDSPNDTPTRSNTPYTDIVDIMPAYHLRKSIRNEYFEKKLDDFLKEARSKVKPTTSIVEITSETQLKAIKPNEAKNKKPELEVKTPVAVRHLPVASQEEYRRLVQRMRILEKRKETKGNSKNINDPSMSIMEPITSEVTPKPLESALTASTASNSSAQTNAVPNAANDTSKIPMQTTKNRLRDYELSYKKIGTGMISNLNKSLTLVEQAKKSKISRLQYDQQLRDLYKQVEDVKLKIKQEQMTISKIQPKIQSNHEIIIALNKRRNKLQQAATDLGKSIIGDEYRLYDDAKEEITNKSNKLTHEIRIVNSLTTINDLEKNNLLMRPNNATIQATKDSAVLDAIPALNLESTTKTNDKKNADNVMCIDGFEEVAKNYAKMSVEMPRTQSKSESQTQPINDDQTKDCNAALLLTENLLAKKNACAAEIIQNVSNAKTIENLPGCTNTEKIKDVAAAVTETVKTTALNKTIPMTDIAYDASIFHELRSEDTCERRKLPEEELSAYISPLMAFKYCTSQNQMDPNGLICPYQLKGNCEDTECSFIHLECVPNMGTAATAKAKHQQKQKQKQQTREQVNEAHVDKDERVNRYEKGSKKN